MAFRRACSYCATIRTPEAPSTYSEIIVVFSQSGENLVTKTEEDLDTDETSVIVKLTQEETARFKAAVPMRMQIRCYASEYNAPGSACWPIDVQPSLDDRILGEE